MSEQRVDLDRPETYAAVDTQDMMGQIAGLPKQIERAWDYARLLELPDKHADIFSFIVVGIGGAAMSGDFLRAIVAHTAQIPVVVVRGYELPAFVGPDSTVVGVSHSGNTEETITLFEEAIDRGAKPIIVTSGGHLATLSVTHRAPLVNYSVAGAKPRTAVGYMFMSLLGIARAVHLTRGMDEPVTEAVAVLQEARAAFGPDVRAADNPAKQMAREFAGKIPLIYAAGFLEPVTLWWKEQLGANAKTSAIIDSPPELNHTSVLGYAHPAGNAGRLAAVQLRSSYDHPRVALHWQVTTDLLEQSGIACGIVTVKGQTRLAQMLWCISLGDWVSYYLALLNGVDPTPEAALAYMKQTLTSA